MREAWTVVEAFWTTTKRQAQSLPEADVHRSVDDEWSFAETLRHLVFVTDAWFGHAILGQARPFHPLGLPPSFVMGADAFGIDTTARPAFEDVVRARAGRVAMVRAFVESVSQDDLDRVREPNTASGFPTPEARTATACMHVLLNEEWAHHRFATLDLAVLEAG
jgi:DinB superfamily